MTNVRPNHSICSHIGRYVELTKPRLTMVALITTLVGFCLGTGKPMNVGLLIHALMGTALLGAGLAALNQYFERRRDALMPRTAGRPLPSGRMRPKEALAFGILISIAGLLQLQFAVNPLTAGLATVTLFLYLCCYIPLKGITPWCTLVGAVPGALPPVIGYTAASGRIDAGAIVLFAILFLWQMPHFLAIATVYREQYRDAGMPMLPVVDPDGTRTARHIVIYSLALLVATLWPSYVGLSGNAYLMVAVFLGFIFGAFAFEAAIGRTIQSARRLFLASVLYLPLLLGVMIWDRLPAS